MLAREGEGRGLRPLREHRHVPRHMLYAVADVAVTSGAVSRRLEELEHPRLVGHEGHAVSVSWRYLAGVNSERVYDESMGVVVSVEYCKRHLLPLLDGEIVWAVEVYGACRGASYDFDIDEAIGRT